MGRYYSGDIEGKFWFAVQPSDAADRFGVKGETTHISYYFSTENLPEIEAELNRISENLGKYKEKLDKFFNKNCGYNNEELTKYLKCSEEKVKELLREYADFQLGTKIANCVKENEVCGFDAEL